MCSSDLESSFTEDYDPIADWITYLPKWDGTDRIDKFAQRVKTDNQDWVKNFHLWFIGMVSQWMRRNSMHGNSLVPLLVGEQETASQHFAE